MRRFQYNPVLLQCSLEMPQTAKMSSLRPSNSGKWLTFLSNNLATMRETDIMCDTMVRASDGQTFPAHACILAASSPILKSSLIHKSSSSQYEVKLDGISGDIWQKLIVFIYSGKLDVPVTRDVLYAAKQLKIRSFLSPTKQLDDNLLNSCSRDGSSEDRLGAAEQEIETFQTSSMEHDRLIGDRSDGGDNDVNAGDDSWDSDTVDYSVGNNEDMREICDEMKLESSNICPAIHQSPLSTGFIKLEKTSPDIVNSITSTTQKSDSVILQCSTMQKCPTFKRQFLCDKCPKTFCYKTAFLKHKKHHTEKRTAAEQTLTVGNTEKNRYKCDQCNKQYRSLFVLKRHQILHSADNPHVCSICGKQFTQNSDIRQHMRTHTGEKPCVCSFCGKTFTSVSSLNVHNRTHYPEKPHKCSTCDRCFSCQAYLQRHLVVHGALKAHQCTKCGKSFRDSGVLKVHWRVHTRERPLKCDVCGKSFRESSALLSHKRRHTGEKPFVCETCGKTFTTTSHMYTHARTHLK